MKRLAAAISKDSASISSAHAGDKGSGAEFEGRALAACPRTIRRNKMTGDQMVGPTVVQIRMGIGPALINGKRTTGQETAFWGRVDRPGNTTLDLDLWTSVRGSGTGTADKRPVCTDASGSREHPLWAHLHDLSQIHHCDPVAHVAGHRQIMVMYR